MFNFLHITLSVKILHFDKNRQSRPLVYLIICGVLWTINLNKPWRILIRMTCLAVIIVPFVRKKIFVYQEPTLEFYFWWRQLFERISRYVKFEWHLCACICEFGECVWSIAMTRKGNKARLHYSFYYVLSSFPSLAPHLVCRLFHCPPWAMTRNVVLWSCRTQEDSYNEKEK